MRRLRSLAPLRAGALLAAVALILAACGGGGTEQHASQAPQGGSAGDGLKAVCDAAAKEGTLVYWNDFANPDEIFDAFNEAYPDIEVESLQLRPDDAAQRVLAEHTAGKQPTPDLLHGGLDVFSSVIDAGVIDTSVDWKSLGVASDLVTQGGMVRLQRDPGGIVYNTEKLKPADLPNTWEDLIDPKWAGQVAVDPRGRPWDQLSLAWGQDETIDFVTRLKQVVRPVMIVGATAGIVAVAGGEVLMGTGGLTSEVEAQKQKGAPVALKYLDTIPTLDADNAVVAGSRHPNAAKCFTGWVVTDGVEAFQEAELKTNETSPSSANGAQVVAIDSTRAAQQVADMSERVAALLR